MTREEIQALIDAAPQGTIGPHQGSRPVVEIPWGHHVLDGPLVLSRRLELDFRGGALILPPGVPGIRVAPGSWHSLVRRVSVLGQARSGQTHGTDGILTEAYGTQFDDVLVRWCGTGIRVNGTGALNANDTGGAGTKLHDCDVGLRLEGGDANGGTWIGTVLLGCRVGISDAAFLGNGFLSTMWHTISEHAYLLDPAAVANYSTFAGTYLEIDCGHALPGGVSETIQDGPLTTWLGGGAVPYAAKGSRVGLSSSRLRFGDRTPAGRVQVTIPHGTVDGALTAEWQTSGGQPVEGMRLRRVPTLRQTGFEVYRPGGSPPSGDGLTRPLGWTGPTHAEGFGRAKVDAQHFSVGAPAGHSVGHDDG